MRYQKPLYEYGLQIGLAMIIIPVVLIFLHGFGVSIFKVVILPILMIGCLIAFWRVTVGAYLEAKRFRESQKPQPFTSEWKPYDYIRNQEIWKN